MEDLAHFDIGFLNFLLQLGPFLRSISNFLTHSIFQFRLLRLFLIIVVLMLPTFLAAPPHLGRQYGQPGL